MQAPLHYDQYMAAQSHSEETSWADFDYDDD
jgi:hypothetical protein